MASSNAGSLFDAVIIVDWSAASTPRTGADSIWIHERIAGGEMSTSNPATRQEALGLLADRLSDLLAQGRRVLAGFDFAFGYPQGFAARIAPHAPNWFGVWKALSARIRDDARNGNNRYEVASELNQSLFGGPYPFWGHPAGQSFAGLTPTRPQQPAKAGDPSEFRLADRRAKGPQSVWKLAYAGSVGGQTLTGLPVLQALRHHPWLKDQIQVWPFETGLSPPPDEARIVIAEVYPSLVARAARPGEVKDETQVKVLAEHLMALDADGALAGLLSGPDDLSPEERQAIEQEEGWILGIETAQSPAKAGSMTAPKTTPETTPVTAQSAVLPVQSSPVIKDPVEIYQRSFAIIRAEADLSAIPPELEPLAVRLIHACGMTDLPEDLHWGGDVLGGAKAAFSQAKPVFCDVEMVARGVITAKLPGGSEPRCTLTAPETTQLANKLGTTRSAAAVELWGPALEGALVAIGNAPTALFHLIDVIKQTGVRPAVIIGMPVGFVGAAESKDLLVSEALGVPYVTVLGRRGGSAMAAAAVNALADLAAGRRGGSNP